MKTFAQKIKAERSKRGFTQTEMGNFLGVTQRMILSYETAGRRPHRRKMQQFADALELPFEYLYNDKYDSVLSVFDETSENTMENDSTKTDDDFADTELQVMAKLEMEFLQERSTVLFAEEKLPQELKDDFFQSLYESYLNYRKRSSDSDE